MARTRTEFLSWARDKQSVLAELSLELVDATETHLQLTVGGAKLQILIPSTYQLLAAAATADLNEVFIIMTVGDVDDKVDAAMLTLNEKLERISVRTGALHEVLDTLLAALTKLENVRLQRQCELGKRQFNDCRLANKHEDSEDDKCWESEGDGLSDSEDANSEDDYNNDDGEVDASCYDIAMGETMIVCTSEQESRSRGFLHAQAEDARKACEAAQRAGCPPSAAGGPSEDPLMWCRVVSNPILLRVQLQFELAGIVDELVAAGLNLSLDEPVMLNLEFPKSVWSESIFRGHKPLVYERTYASQATQRADAAAAALQMEKEPDEIDTFLDRQAQKLQGGDHKSYGLEILFPEFTAKFFDARNRQTSTSGTRAGAGPVAELAGLTECAAQANPFLGLARFISHQLLLLPNWCLVCWRALPHSVARMRTCDQDLCLFRFEELGLGVSVLQEVRNSGALVDLELSLAVAAVESARDVFEPFPAFLLDKEEMRGRSGWFSSLGAKAVATRVQNKRFSALRSVLSSIPATTELQKCTSEGALKKVLMRAWYELCHRHNQPLSASMPVGLSRCEIVATPVLRLLYPTIATGEHHSKNYNTRYPAEALQNSEQWAKERRMAYDVMRFVLTTNRLSLRVLGADEQVIGHDTIFQFVVLHDTPEREAHFTQRRAEAGGSFFAFHGSAAENWYSILRNGLRSMSNTAYMSAGASYGEGIYFGGTLATSFHYARASTTSWDKGPLKDGFQCLAICEIVKGSTRNGRADFSSRSIVVVPREHEQDVAIRYLLVFRPGSQHGPAGRDYEIQGSVLAGSLDLSAHYRELRVRDEEARQVRKAERVTLRYKALLAATAVEIPPLEVGTPAAPAAPASPTPKNKAAAQDQERPQAPKRGRLAERLGAPPTMVSRPVMQEFNTLMKAIERSPPLPPPGANADAAVLSGVSVDIPDEANICRWRVTLSPHLFRHSALAADLAELRRLRGAKDDVAVILEVKFPPTYPFAPPFVRVLSPKFVMRTGHVTVGGSICMELLTASGWSPACSFESLLVQVVMAFVEGEGRLDLNASMYGHEYQEHEAREAFARAARIHGWKTS